MAVQGENSILISFECTELIEELEEDIRVWKRSGGYCLV